MGNLKNTQSSIGLGILTCLGLLLLGIQIKSGLTNISDDKRVVSVRGLSERIVSANKVTWPIVNKEVGNDLTSIYQRIENTNNLILKFLTDNGIAGDEISIDAPSVIDMEAERYVSPDVRFRYNVTNVIVVTSSNVEKVNELIKRQSELLKQGIAILAGDYQYQTVYEYTALNDIKPEMIAEATENAREAAKKFAEDSDSKLGKIKTASQGQFTIEDRDQYTPFIKKIRVVSSVVYYLRD